MVCENCFKGTYEDGYEEGFFDSKQKALDIIHKLIYGPFDSKNQEICRKIYEEIERM